MKKLHQTESDRNESIEEEDAKNSITSTSSTSSTSSKRSTAYKTANDTKEKFMLLLPALKIITSYTQIVTNFSFVFEIKFPPVFSSMMDIVGSIVNVDIINFMPLDCVVVSNFHSKLVGYTLTPLFLGGIMLAFYWKLGKSGEEWSKHRNWIFSMFLLGTFYVLPSETLKIGEVAQGRLQHQL